MTDLSTSLNTNAAASAGSGSTARRQPELTNAQANRLSGLGSGLPVDQTIERIVSVERKRLEPIQNQRKQIQTELDAFGMLQEDLTPMKETSGKLAGRAIWEGKLVESSDEDVVQAIATSGAKPGKHTLVVDRLALNHQIASQGFETPETVVGQGKFILTVGESNPVTVVVDESNNTLEALKGSINSQTDDVQAAIIKTGNVKRPYQLVLTSQKTGSAGRITVDITLEGGETPSFKNFVEEPSDWLGVGEEEGLAPLVTGEGASTAIVRVVGEYTGEEDHTFTFTAVQNGTVGGENPLQLRWNDDSGRSGVIDLDSFNYAPGEPAPFVDGLSLIVSKGDVVVSDNFTFRARAQRSDLFWWLEEGDRTAAYTQPSSWSKQATFGAPIVEGPYTGDEAQRFTLTVEGDGQIGTSQNLNLRWESELGETGVLRVGRGYTPGAKLALTQGLTLSLKPGVLSEGQVVTFDVTPEEVSGRWWLDEEERRIPSEVLNITNWSAPAKEGEEVSAQFGQMPEFPEDIGPQASTTEVSVAGEYEGDEAKVYTFTALKSGSVGTTKDLSLKWEDDKGNSGSVSIGDNYTFGAPVPFDAGLALMLGDGIVRKGDSFTLRVRTSTIQPAQDAKIRFGATELGGGLEITNSTNELEDVIEGVKLNLVSVSEKPVTITIKGDTEKALEEVLSFVDQYNATADLVAELTKYDKKTNVAGPLLGRREVTDIQNRLSGMLINPVAGLPRTDNMLFNLGIKLNDQGRLTVEEDTLRNKIEGDFGVVSNIFRDRGQSDNPAISFIGLTDDTRISTEGYPVRIDKAATQGFYQSPPLGGGVRITPDNNRFFITVDGRRSDEMTIRPGDYTLDEYASQLQNLITNDEKIGDRGVRIILDNGGLKAISGRFGESSGVTFDPGEDQNTPSPGLEGGSTTPGTNVEGSINGAPAEGTGQLLKATEASGEANGLRVFVKLTESQVQSGEAGASVTITRGVASRVGKYLDELIDPLTGTMNRITASIQKQVDNYDDQLSRLNERIDNKRASLQERFSRMESKLSSLRSQQQFMSSQLGGGGAGGIPGLPGL